MSFGPAFHWKLNIFVDGRSISGGSTLAEARIAAPEAMSRFEDMTYVPVTGVAESPLAPRWLVLVLMASLAALLATALPGPGIAAGSLILIGGLGLSLVVIRTWFVLTARVRRYLIGRGDLSDASRMIILGLAYVGGAIVAFVTTSVAILAVASISAAVARLL